MSDVVYTSEVRLERLRGPLRLAHLPVEPLPVTFGTHGPIARHYGVQGDVPEPHATTIDYLVAAAGGWLLGTLGGALEARGIAATEGRLSAVARGEVEVEEGVLVLRRIHVIFTLRGAEREVDAAERAHQHYKPKCPIYRSIHRAIDVTSELRLEGLPAGLHSE